MVSIRVVMPFTTPGIGQSEAGSVFESTMSSDELKPTNTVSVPLAFTGRYWT